MIDMARSSTFDRLRTLYRKKEEAGTFLVYNVLEFTQKKRNSGQKVSGKWKHMCEDRANGDKLVGVESWIRWEDKRKRDEEG